MRFKIHIRMGPKQEVLQDSNIDRYFHALEKLRMNKDGMTGKYFHHGWKETTFTPFYKAETYSKLLFILPLYAIVTSSYRSKY